MNQLNVTDQDAKQDSNPEHENNELEQVVVNENLIEEVEPNFS